MEPQNFEKTNIEIRNKFKEFIKTNDLKEKLKFSWSNWGFGLEPIERSLERLNKYNVKYIELHGNRYGDDLGYDSKELKKVLEHFDIKVSGICGMVWKESELASTSPSVRPRCIDYFQRNNEV